MFASVGKKFYTAGARSATHREEENLKKERAMNIARAQCYKNLLL